MRKINIIKNYKISTKSYNEKLDLIYDLKFILDFPLHKNYREELADKIWNLNYGCSYNCFGFRFTVHQNEERI